MDGRTAVHFTNKDLLGLGAKVAMHGRLDLEEVLNHIFQAVCDLDKSAWHPAVTHDSSGKAYCRQCPME